MSPLRRRKSTILYDSGRKLETNLYKLETSEHIQERGNPNHFDQINFEAGLKQTEGREKKVSTIASNSSRLSQMSVPQKSLLGLFTTDITTLISLSVVFCCSLALILNVSSFFVQAHIGELGRPSRSGEAPKHQRQQIGPTDAAPATKAPNSYDPNEDNDNHDQDDGSDSIDRFDVGEQIQAPLLRSQTTLAPLRRTDSNLRRSDHIGNSQLTDDRDQDDGPEKSGHLTPEERDQWMRSQEAHYEGGGDQDGPAASNPGRAEQPKLQQSANYNKHLQQPLASVNNNNEPVALNQDDEDYQDGQEGEQVAPRRMRPRQQVGRARGASAVPERRGDGSMSQMQELKDARTKVNNNNQLEPESEAVDQTNAEDYSGANEDSFFSRKPSQANSPRALSASQLKLAASNNRQLNDVQSLARQRQNRLESDVQEAPLSQADAISTGEPRLRDNQLEANDSDDDGEDDESASALSPPSTDEPDGGPIAPRADGFNAGANQPIESQLTQDANQANNPDNYAAAASSSHSAGPQSSGDQRRQQPSFQQIRSSSRQTGPTSFNSTATRTVTSDQARLRQQAADDWFKARLNKNPHLSIEQNSEKRQHQTLNPINPYNNGPTLQAPGEPAQTANHDSKSSQAPYNPQNNPSHAGKYFIN